MDGRETTVEHGHGLSSARETADAPRYATPTKACCPRALRVDGSVEGSGDCLGCGFCLLIAEAAWAPAR